VRDPARRGRLAQGDWSPLLTHGVRDLLGLGKAAGRLSGTFSTPASVMQGFWEVTTTTQRARSFFLCALCVVVVILLPLVSHSEIPLISMGRPAEGVANKFGGAIIWIALASDPNPSIGSEGWHAFRTWRHSADYRAVDCRDGRRGPDDAGRITRSPAFFALFAAFCSILKTEENLEQKDAKDKKRKEKERKAGDLPGQVAGGRQGFCQSPQRSRYRAYARRSPARASSQLLVVSIMPCSSSSDSLPSKTWLRRNTK
jgi:hypothetical protein